MQLVIDVSEQTKRDFEDEYSNNEISKITIDAILEAFTRGTVLPKGHGRLIDADALEKYVIEKYSDGEQLAIDITDAPTVLEATEAEDADCD